jgi:hypothetical protein
VVLYQVVILRSFRDRVKVLQVSVSLSLSLSRHHTFVRYKATYPLLAANYLGCKAYCREDRAIPGPFFEAVPIMWYQSYHCHSRFYYHPEIYPLVYHLLLICSSPKVQ